MTTQLLGQSDLDTFLHCGKRFYYRHVRGLIPRSANSAMSMGTLFHLGAAAGYRFLQAGENGLNNTAAHKDGTWLSWAHYAARNEKLDRDGVALGLDDEQRENVCDMLAYYWEHVGQHDRFDRIIAVEEPILIHIDLGGGVALPVRCTLDLVVEWEGQPVIIDHKTGDAIDSDMGHLPLDGQTHRYYIAAWKHYGRPMAFVHNFVRRFERKAKICVGPPDFKRANGQTPYAFTDTKKARTASTDPNDYVRRVRTPLTEAQLVAYERELYVGAKLLSIATDNDLFARVDSKLGFACPSCPYYGPCTTELDGRTVDDGALKLIYDFAGEQNPAAQIAHGASTRALVDGWE